MKRITYKPRDVMASVVFDSYMSGSAGQSRLIRKPRILYVVTTRHFGGLELASVRLAAMLNRNLPDNQEILIACLPNHEIERQCSNLGIETRPLRIANSGDLKGVGRLISLIIDEKIDIVHVHSRRDYVVAALAIAQLRRLKSANPVKLVLHLHLVRKLGDPTFLSGMFFAPIVDRFVAVSATVRNNLLGCHKQINSDQVTIVPNGIEFENFVRNPISRIDIRQQYSIPDDAFVLGMIGRLDTKGQIIGIKALQGIQNSNVYILLIGASGKPGYLELLKKRSEKLGVEDRVIFCGSHSDIAPYLSAIDALLHLPHDEAFGLAPAEAMSSGLPVVVSNSAACVELVHDGVTGIVVNQEHVNEVSCAIDRLIDSANLRSALGSAAAKSVHERFTIDKQATAMTSVYSELMAIPHL